MRPGRSDPYTLLQAVLSGLGSISTEGVSLLTMSIAWQTVLAVDAAGEPMDEARTWESTALAERQTRAVALTVTGAYDHPSFPVYHLEELLAVHPVRLCDLGGWLLGKLAGRDCGWSEPIAAGSGMWDQTRRRWVSTIPEQARSVLGQLWREPVTVSADGLLAGTDLAAARLAPPIGDGFAVNLGLGALGSARPVAVTVGTSGSVRQIHREAPPVVPGLWRFRLSERAWASGGAITSAGNVLEWAAGVFGAGHEEEAVARWLGSADDLPDVIADPDVFGRRGPDYPIVASGGLRGLKPATTRQDLLRAFQVDVFQTFSRLHGMLGRPGPVVAAGGALSQDHGLFRLLAGALDRPVLRTECAEPALRGAGLLGAVTLDVVHEPVDALVEALYAGLFPSPPVSETIHPERRLAAALRLRWEPAA